MSEPRRLLEEGGDFERALLHGWKDEKPSPAARTELFALAGIAATAETGRPIANRAWRLPRKRRPNQSRW